MYAVNFSLMGSKNLNTDNKIIINKLGQKTDKNVR